MNRKRIAIRRCAVVALSAVALAVAGCGMRSISNSGPPDRYGRSDNPFYKGELSALYVLGVDPSKTVSEKDIVAALETTKKVALRKGDSVLLIQSGAAIPDSEMTQAMEKYFTVGIYSGVPDEQTDGAQQATDAENRSRVLRLAAAKGGYGTIVCCWGLLETSQKGLATKGVSWVPVVGWSLPDETQRMRVRLKAAVVDVRTGAWATFSPAAFDDTQTSAITNREGTDQTQVATLKAKAYTALAEELARRFAR